MHYISMNEKEQKKRKKNLHYVYLGNHKKKFRYIKINIVIDI